MEFIADRVIELLGSLASKELEFISNFQEDLESMKSMVTAINAVLLDAERKAPKRHLIDDWLQKLKDVLLDAEDLLDACSADELAREVMTKGKKTKEVRIFFSKYNRTVCAAKMGREIRAIRKKLEGIFNEKNNLHLGEISSSNASYESPDRRPLSHSFVREEDVVGREAEKKRLVSTLLNPAADVENNVSVVAIVGIGGLGKTTLAQQVYNEEAVKKHFELMKWVCVSDEFSIKSIAENIIGRKCDTMDEVAQGLRETTEGKHFLLVLDDVWNEDREEWLNLESLLRGGKKGSVVIVTTRSDTVAQIMAPLEHLSLQGLDEDNCWKLFCRVAFRDGKQPDDQKLVDIGKDIVRKCAGVPLAIRTIGSLLFTKKLVVSEWSYFRDTELADIDSANNKIMSILKLSYDHLPSHLKNCFAFCSLFPKDSDIHRETLIQLWMAEGFIQSLDKNRRLEDVGGEYFEQLLSRCLFQDVTRYVFDDIVRCKMHDLIHDLAQSITKKECYIITSERIDEAKLSDKIRHVSSHSNGAKMFPFDNVKSKKMRTILSLERFPKPIRGSTISLPKHLRVLVLSHQQVEIPESIGDLKHLRYLDLSGNDALRKLPRGISKLHNLLTLKLIECQQLKKLPREMQRLVKLRHLELSNCFALASLPKSIGSLTSLQKLDLSSCEALASLSESIGSLTSLQKLDLSSCEALASLPESIGCLTSLQKLDLSSCTALASLPESIGSLTSLQELRLSLCEDLASLPESIGSLKSLQKLNLSECTSLASLPESIGSLTSLRELDLSSCTALASLPESIGSLTLLQKLDLSSCTSLASLPESIGSLTSLQKLDLSSCEALASLPESIGSLISLQKLDLSSCEALASLPESIGSLISLQKLDLSSCTSLASLPESIGSLKSLQKLNLSECTSLASLPESIGSLTSLQKLDLSSCEALASLPESIGSLISLQKLDLSSCEALASLPESIGSLISLQKLDLSSCTSLASLPESIGSLKSLQKLNLSECTSLASLPESIGSLKSLQELDLSNYTSLASLPESIGSLTSLQKLGFFLCTSLASLPESIGSLTSLQERRLFSCTSLASLPESIGSLTSLQELDLLLSCTALASLPRSIKSHTRLHQGVLIGQDLFTYHMLRFNEQI